MFENQMYRNGILLGLLTVILCVSLVFAQSEETGTEITKQSDPETETSVVVPSTDPALDAEFDARIAEIRADAEVRVADLQAALESSRGEDKEGYLREMESVNREAEISILEVRAEQEMARGNEEMADKFLQAAEMLRNPPQRQAPDPEVDRARLEQLRTQPEQENTR
jgi:hypothetical protein